VTRCERATRRTERELRHTRIRADARRRLAELGVTRPDEIDLDALAARAGAHVSIEDLEGASARVLRIQDHAKIVISKRLVDVGAIRFSIAHELAHLSLGHWLDGRDARAIIDRLCDPLRSDDQATERDASVHASETLMPEPMVRPLCTVSQATLEAAHTIAREFRMSVLASAMRFVELTTTCCAIVYSELGRVRWVKPSATFRAWIPSGMRIDPASAAFDYAARGVIDPAPRLIDAEAWIPQRWLDGSHVDVIEHCAVVSELGAVIALVWVPDRDVRHLDLPGCETRETKIVA
jgi:Zn-dependent peptidase ImmA (M78 family)